MNRFGFRHVMVGASLLALGFGAGAWSFRKDSTSPVALDQSYNDKLHTLIDREIAELRSITNEVERNRRLEALLEKILKLFLIDVSLRLNQKSAATSAPTLAAPVASTSLTAATQGPSSGRPVTVTTPQSATTPSGKFPVSAEVESKITSSVSIADAEKEISKAQIPDLFDYVRQLRPAAAEQVQPLFGKWMGQIDYADSRPAETLTIVFSQTGQDKYHSEIILESGGHVNSKSAGDGNLKDISTLEGMSSAIYIRHGGGEYFLQLYYVNHFWVANAYETKDGKIVPAGKSVLQRAR